MKISPHPITPQWLRDHGWEWDNEVRFFFLQEPNLFLIALMDAGIDIDRNSDAVIKQVVVETDDLMEIKYGVFVKGVALRAYLSPVDHPDGMSDYKCELIRARS